MFFLKNIKRSIISKNFVISLIISALCILIGVFISLPNISYFGNLSLFFAGSSVFGVSPITFLSVIVCTLPFSDKMMADSESKFLLFETSRITKLNYTINMIIVAGISGSIALLTPYILLLVINVILWGSSNINIGATPEIFSEIYTKSQLFYSILIIVGYAIFGFVYSIMGMASSLLFKKKIFAIVGPFIFYLGGGLLFSALGLSKFEPVGTFDLSYQSQVSIGEVFIQLLLILALSILTIFYLFYVKYEEYI